jgi:hypothetical protein
MMRWLKRFWCAIVDRHEWQMDGSCRDGKGNPHIWCKRCDTEVDL